MKQIEEVKQTCFKIFFIISLCGKIFGDFLPYFSVKFDEIENLVKQLFFQVIETGHTSIKKHNEPKTPKAHTRTTK